MENNNSKLLWGLAIGAATGFVLGYLLSGKKMDEMNDDLKNLADKFRANINDAVDKSKEVLNNMKQTSSNENNPNG